LDSPLLCMPNEGYDPSAFSGVPVEIGQGQGNNESRTVESISTDQGNCVNNDISLNEGSRFIQSREKILGFLRLNSFTNKARRRFFWYICESERSNFSSYKDFKNNWNPDTKIYAEIKKDISDDLDKIKLHKKTLSWLLNVRKRNRNRNWRK